MLLWPLALPQVCWLRRNYRSHASLLDLPSRMFYHSQLQACAESGTQAPPWEELREVRRLREPGAAGMAGLVLGC